MPLTAATSIHYPPPSLLQDAIDRGHFCLDRSDVEKGPNMEAVLATAAEMASALCFLHKANVVHGDLSGERGGKGGRQGGG